MSETLANLIESIEVIQKLRSSAAGLDFAWNKLYNAARYLQVQVDQHFSE